MERNEKLILNFDKEGLDMIRDLWKKNGVIFDMDKPEDRRMFVYNLNCIFKNQKFDYLLEDNYLLNIFITAFGVDGEKKVNMVELYNNLEKEADNGTILYAITT